MEEPAVSPDAAATLSNSIEKDDSSDLCFDNDDGRGSDFVPDSLAKFFSKSKATFDDMEASLRQHLKPDGSPRLPTNDPDGEVSTAPDEDDQDRQLKQEIMEKYKQNSSVLFSPAESDLALTPPPNPTIDMTLSQAKHMALHNTNEKVLVGGAEQVTLTVSSNNGNDLTHIFDEEKELPTQELVNRSLEGELQRAAVPEVDMPKEEPQPTSLVLENEPQPTSIVPVVEDDSAFLPNRAPPITVQAPAPQTETRRAAVAAPPSKVTTRRPKPTTRSRPVSIHTKNSAGPGASSKQRVTPRSSNSSTSRLLQGTAASRARSSPPAKKVLTQSNRRDPYRVQQSSARSSKRQTPPGKLQIGDVNSKSAIDSEKKAKEAQARAKERIRQRKEQEQKAGKENATREQLMAERKRRMSTSSLRVSSWDPNPISRASGTPTHGSSVVPMKTAVSRGSRRKSHVTVPKPPRLSTLAKYGDKPPPTVVAKKEAQAPSPTAKSVSSRPQRTIPKPFHFHGKPQSKPPVTPREADLTLAEQMEALTRKGFGDFSKGSTPPPTDGKVTIPKTPHFSIAHKRALPKSTAQKEEEEMEYFRQHPFRAKPIMQQAPPPAKPKNVSRRRTITTVQPFHLRSDERAAHAKPLPPPSDQADLQECKKRFHARPMPSTKSRPPRTTGSLPNGSAPKKSTVTTPAPFHLSTRTRSEPRRAAVPEEKKHKPFHARPVPKSTFTPSVTPGRMKNSSSSTSRATPAAAKSLGPPRLATMTRSDRRQAATESSRRNADAMAREKKQLAIRRQREYHQEEMAKSLEHSPLLAKSPGKVQPFHLESEERHAACVRERQTEMRHELEQEQKLMEFHARPFHASPPPKPLAKPRHMTEPEPFHLRSVALHERSKSQEMHDRMAAEEQEERASRFVARSVPKTTYKAQPVAATTPKPKLVSPHGPKLHSELRAEQRREFDKSVEMERQREAEEKLALERQLQAEQEADIREKRHLPSSEGGFMPTVEPVNAVFHNSRGQQQEHEHDGEE